MCVSQQTVIVLYMSLNVSIHFKIASKLSEVHSLQIQTQWIMRIFTFTYTTILRKYPTNKFWCFFAYFWYLLERERDWKKKKKRAMSSSIHKFSLQMAATTVARAKLKPSDCSRIPTEWHRPYSNFERCIINKLRKLAVTET